MSGTSRPANAEESPANVGLYGKYYGLRRTRNARQVITDDGQFWLEGGSLVEGWYFVIREGDEAGWAALEAYADTCESYAPELAADLRAHVRDERLAKRRRF